MKVIQLLHIVTAHGANGEFYYLYICQANFQLPTLYIKGKEVLSMLTRCMDAEKKGKTLSILNL